jgi:MSHA biogenesis protein MshJ
MKARLLALAARFDALARRERMLLAAAAVVAIILPGYSTVIEPALVATQADSKRSDQARVEIANLNAQIGALKQQVDPDAANRKAFEEVRVLLSAGDAKLKAMEATMVPPEKMRVFIESLLTRHRQVELLGLRTLLPSPVFESAAGESAGSNTEALGPNIYKHGVEIRIAGHYNDLLAYLAELEQMPQRILWNKVSLSVDAYPRSVLTVTVYTLSLDKKWLIV